MFVSNKTNRPIGVDGVVILRPNEQNRFVQDTPEFKTRVDRLLKADLVQVSYEEGLSKVIDEVKVVTKVEVVDSVKVVNTEPVKQVDEVITTAVDTVVNTVVDTTVATVKDVDEDSPELVTETEIKKRKITSK